ncbi:MAG: hypothetical protein FWJ70_09885 [Micromonosporaceae bacterium]
MPVNPPPPALRISPWVSRLGRAAVVVLVAGVVLTAVATVNGALPFWLIPVGMLLALLGVVQAALWTIIRLVAVSVRPEVRQRND